MAVGTNSLTCGFNWQCTADAIGYAVMITARRDSLPSPQSLCAEIKIIIICTENVTVVRHTHTHKDDRAGLRGYVQFNKYTHTHTHTHTHIQRIVLATEKTTVTQQVSPRPIKCQSRLWSQRGTKVNGSHHGDNPLLRPTGIQIATKSYAALQAMAPTNIKTVHQTSLLHIESNLDRLGMLSPTHDQRSQQKTGKITLQPVLINKSKFLKATHFVQK